MPGEPFLAAYLANRRYQRTETAGDFD